MELKYYSAILRRRIWIVLFTALIAASVAAFWSYSLQASYTASAMIWVPTTNDVDTSTGDVQLADRLMNTYAQLATSGAVLRELSGLVNIPVRDLKDMISVSSIPLTELLTISVASPDPQLAAKSATDLASILIRQTLATKSGRDRRISLFAPAAVPDIPTWLGSIPTTLWRELNIAVGLVLGLLAGIALAFLYEYIDNRLYTKEQIEAVTNLQTLGQIPLAKKPHLFSTGNGWGDGEAFRYLRTTLFFDHTSLPRTLLITSAMPGEGKSTVVANLALAIAQSRRDVIVVDADLRLPTLHHLFNLPTDVGLSTILSGKTDLHAALQPTSDTHVRVITSGPTPSNPGELLDSPQFANLLEQLRQEADYVLFDSPASLAVSDAAVIAPQVDGVLLVVSRAHAVQEAVRAARTGLAAAGANFAGLVVNRVDQVGAYARHYSPDS